MLHLVEYREAWTVARIICINTFVPKCDVTHTISGFQLDVFGIWCWVVGIEALRMRRTW